MNIVDIRQIVESVVKEVVTSMKVEESSNVKSNVLIVLDDKNAYEFYKDQMSELKNNQIDFDVLLLEDETTALNGLVLSTINVIAAKQYSSSELANKYACIVLPEIDLNDAARVATGIKGSIKSELMYYANLLGRSILLNNDVSGITRNEQNALHIVHPPAPYKKLFDHYLKLLTELGVRLIDFKQLVSVIERKLQLTIQEKQIENDFLQQENSSNGLKVPKKLLTSEWLESQSHIPNNTIFVKKKTIISPLAKDLMKERGLTIRYID